MASHPGKGGKREIARALGLKGADRIGLKSLLKEMEHEGLIDRRGKRLRQGGTLPKVTVLLVEGRDEDGELVAVPLAWDADAHGPAPRVLVMTSGPGRGPKASGASARPPGVGDRVLTRLSPGEGPGEGFDYVGWPIKVLGAVRNRVLGVLRFSGQRPCLVPIDRKQRELNIDPLTIGEAESGDLIAVDPGDTRGRGQSARMIERIGSMRSEHAISTIALLDHDIPHVFPDSVLAEAEAVAHAGIEGREDWREIPFVTIDPADARDHDDAVFARPDDNPGNAGGHVVLVAIADVAHAVRPGSELDREARKRGNSVYFPDRVVPMLPERVSNDLCSLRERENRAALAARLVFDSEGRKKTHSFHRVLMRSAARLSYQQAQAAFEGRTDDVTGPLSEPILRPLHDAYQAISLARDSRQPLELHLPEKNIRLKPDGTVDTVFVPEHLEAHRLIEEMMIQANIAAAETLEARQTPVVYRVHDAPSHEKLVSLKEFLSTINLKGPGVGAVRPARFNTILGKVVGTENAEVVNEMILRSQARAEYSTRNIGHFGLNLRRYAHFTSPIRRYADLLVHRALVRALGLGDDGLPPALDGQLEVIAAEVSASERRAMAAERDTIDRLVAHFLADQVGARFAGKITGVVKSGLFVRLSDSGADGFVPASTLRNDYYRLDEPGRQMIGERTGETYRLGDLVEIRIEEAEPLAGALRFQVMTPGRKGTPAGRRRRGRQPGRRG